MIKAKGRVISMVTDKGAREITIRLYEVHGEGEISDKERDLLLLDHDKFTMTRVMDDGENIPLGSDVILGFSL